jgi:hypothetical protein
MLRIRILALGLLGLLGSATSPSEAGWSVGIRLGVPLYIGPCYGCYRPYYYYHPYPLIVQPAPVLVQPVPVAQPVPAMQPTSQSATAAAPAEARPIAPAAVGAQPAVLNQRQLDIDHNMRLLAERDDRTRADAAMHLGRLRAEGAIDPLAATLAGDPSPSVREAAARSLGLIGSSKGLPALQRAAQADADKDVRHTAQYAIDVIQVTRRN